MKREAEIGTAVASLLARRGASDQVVIEAYEPGELHVWDPAFPACVVRIHWQRAKPVSDMLDNGYVDH